MANDATTWTLPAEADGWRQDKGKKVSSDDDKALLGAVCASADGLPTK